MIDTPPLWTAREAVEATGGTTNCDWDAIGVSIDSRSARPGDLFVALAGPRFDGHDYVTDALQNGAAAAVVDRVPDGLPADACLMMVNDTFDALYDLGRYARDRAQATVIAVTGSVGKTSIKEALALVLSYQAPTAASQASLNNHWGVPLTLARLPKDAVYAVVEMGMNHAGELHPLTRLARPHVAVITTIELVHSAHFASVGEIADAKAEIFAGVERRGCAVLNRDNGQYARLEAAAQAVGIETIVGFGGGPESDARVLSCDPEGGGWRLRAEVGGVLLSYTVPLPARHWALNSVCILAAVHAAGADVNGAAEALSGLTAPKGRGEIQSVVLTEGRLQVIDESYNASPVSMASAIGVLGRLQPDGSGRRIAVLGDMLELGAGSHEFHRALLEPLQRAEVDHVFTVGPEMESLWLVLPDSLRGGHAAKAADLLPLLRSFVRAGDLVMVKGSRGIRTDKVVEALLDLQADPPARVVNGA